MGMKGVRKLSQRIFKNFRKRDRDLWRSYEDAYRNENGFLTELVKFLESYDKCLIQIKETERNGGGSDGYMTILEKLKNVNIASGRVHDQNSADQMLLEKVKCLLTQRQDFQDELNQLVVEIGKPRKKSACVRAWRRCLRVVTCMLFIGALAAEFACTVMAAVMVAPLVALAVAAAIIPTLAGQYWTLSWIEESEVPPRYPANVIRLMQSKTTLPIKELGEIQTDLCRVVKDIESTVAWRNWISLPLGALRPSWVMVVASGNSGSVWSASRGPNGTRYVSFGFVGLIGGEDGQTSRNSTMHSMYGYFIFYDNMLVIDVI